MIPTPPFHFRINEILFEPAVSYRPVAPGEAGAVLTIG